MSAARPESRVHRRARAGPGSARVTAGPAEARGSRRPRRQARGPRSAGRSSRLPRSARRYAPSTIDEDRAGVSHEVDAGPRREKRSDAPWPAKRDAPCRRMPRSPGRVVTTASGSVPPSPIGVPSPGRSRPTSAGGAAGRRNALCGPGDGCRRWPSRHRWVRELQVRAASGAGDCVLARSLTTGTRRSGAAGRRRAAGSAVLAGCRIEPSAPADSARQPARRPAERPLQGRGVWGTGRERHLEAPWRGSSGSHSVVEVVYDRGSPSGAARVSCPLMRSGRAARRGRRGRRRRHGWA